MKKTCLVLGILLLICPSSLLAQEWSAAQKEVWSFEQKNYDALQRGDIETMLSMIHPDYRGLNHGTNVPIDKAAFRRSVDGFLKENKVIRYSVQPLSIVVTGNTAVVHYIYLDMEKSADGKETPGQSAWTDVLVKQGDQWLVIADNGNVLPEIPVTTASPEARKAYLEALDRLDDADLAKALSLIETALQKDPNLALAYQVRANLGEPAELAQRDRVTAMSLRNSVSQGERYMILYNDLMSKASIAQAKNYLDTLLLSFPRDKRVQTLAAMYYAGVMGDVPAAIEYMEAALKIDPNFANAYNQLGYWYSKVGKNDAAEQAFRKYVALKPDAANSHDSYAEFLRITGRYDESIAEYQKALSLDPTFAFSIRGIGDCYLKKRDMPKALAEYQLATDKCPLMQDKSVSIGKHAAVHILQGNIPEALSALDEEKELALKGDYNSTAINTEFSEGVLLSSLGKPSEGLKKIKEATKLARELTLTDEMRDFFLTASNGVFAYNSLEAKDLKKAKDYIAAYQKDVERRKNPNEMMQLKSLQGYLDLQEARTEDAIAKFSSLPESPGTLHALVVAYTQKGDKDKAQASLDKLNKWQTLDLSWAIESQQAAMNRGI